MIQVNVKRASNKWILSRVMIKPIHNKWNTLVLPHWGLFLSTR